MPGEIVAMLAIGSAMALGGGGTSNPLTETILQPLLALLVALPLALPRLRTGLAPVSRTCLVLAALVLVVPILQLIPLPPAVWQALPGRDAEMASLGLIDAQNAWMPWTMAPARTFIALLAMVGPVLILLLVAGLGTTGRTWLCVTIAGMGLASMVLGVLQLSHAEGLTWSLYPYYNNGKLDGFQANHNAQADILGIALMAFAVGCTALYQISRRPVLVWSLAATGLAMAMAALFLTGSRTGIALIPVPVAVFAAILMPTVRGVIGRARPRLIAALVAAATLVMAVSGIALLRLPSVGAVLARFARLEDSRADIWTDTLHAIGRVWPFGGGIGSFPVLFNAAERLEVVTPVQAGRAHSDWLEWTLEAGLPGLLVLATFLGLVGLLAWRALRPREERHAGARRRGEAQLTRAHTLFACGTLLLLGLHALDDFPIRAMALASLGAVAIGLLLPVRERTPDPLSSTAP
ncbi:MAG: O-antigen ligase family protein [Novosphingobium aromaticivorans]|nr:O-antigen ligase family protein [Novosphingobium aromaticivorans]